MRNKAGVVIWIIIAACVAPHLFAQEPDARAWADSTEFFIGDPISVHVEITHQSKLSVSPLIGDTLGAFHVLSRGSVKTTSSMSSTTLIVAAYDSGTFILPPVQFSYTTPPDSTIHIVATSPLTFTVHLVEVDTSKAIKDIKPVVSVPFTVAEVSLIVGTIVGLAWLVYSIYWYTKRKNAEKPEEQYVPPSKPAHVIALEELAQLKEKRLWQQGLIKPYYSETTEIVRRYFENRFRFMALEKTTDEILDDLRRHPVAQSIFEQTGKLLRRADLVKFAKYEPSIPEHEEMLSGAFDIIEKTRMRELVSPSVITATRTDDAKKVERVTEEANV